MTNIESLKETLRIIFHRRSFEKYNAKENYFNIRQVQSILYDNKFRIVTVFKENLIWNEPTELLKRYFYHKADLTNYLNRLKGFPSFGKRFTWTPRTRSRKSIPMMYLNTFRKMLKENKKWNQIKRKKWNPTAN
jgi:hypothetical protein